MWRILALLPLAFGTALPAQEAPLSETVRAAMEGALEQPLEQQYDALFDQVQQQTGNPDLLLETLRDIGDDEGAGPERRRAARWIASFFAWRNGDLRDALRLLNSMATEDPGTAVLLRRAQLLDASGRLTAAERAYEEALAADGGADAALETRIRLRLALLGMDGDGTEGDALAEFARAPGRDPAQRNRAANVLALTSRPAEAGELFVVGGEGTERFRQEIRLATWAIRAGDAPTARQHAWLARQAAELTRDRHYALSVLVEAHRLDDSLQALIDRFANTPALDDPSRETWIDLLRETGQVDAAVALFRASKDEFTVDMQRELVEMYRESGREDLMIATYRELIVADPDRLSWREGLSRHYLERGDTAAARDVWEEFLQDESQLPNRLSAAETLAALSLDGLAIRAAEDCVDRNVQRYPALLFLFRLHMNRGKQDLAEQSLARMDRLAPADDGVRAQLSEAYEQLDRLDRAVEVLQELAAARGSQPLAEDLEMRLAWLYSEIDRDDLAVERWQQLWRRVRSVPRQRYVEDRLMTVAARLGTIADIVIELEEKLAAGTADKQDSGLLVRLYTKVNDPVSATEIIDEFLEQTGGDSIEALNAKARIYLACTDYSSYEDTLRELMVVDPDGETEYLRNLVMSQLERGRPDEARDSLTRLRAIEAGSDSAEFEAGVLALAGLREDAERAYRRGVSRHANRIEIYLLLANLMRDTGRTDQAVSMFQYLAETAEQDDLFTIAIDGLLNMEARPSILQWARRVTLKRMAGRHDRMYLYQLLADLSEEAGDHSGRLDALEGSLPIAGVRRPSILRELMDLAKGGRGPIGSPPIPPDPERHLAYGRRLISLAQVVPPQVYLDLGEAFLNADDVRNAVKTFSLARELPDYDVFQRQVAEKFETAGYLQDALRTYERAMISDPTDIGLLVKVAELKEQVGRDDTARELYERALDLMIARQPLITERVEREDPNALPMLARNVDDSERYYRQAIEGLLTTLPESGTRLVLSKIRELTFAGIEQLRQQETDEDGIGMLSRYPRITRLAEQHRRIAFAFSQIEAADGFDAELLAAFPSDTDLLEELCKERIGWGMVVSARNLIESSARPEEQKDKLRFLVGTGNLETVGLVPVAQAARLLLPKIVTGDTDNIESLLLKTDLGFASQEEIQHLYTLFSGALYLGDQNLTLAVGRTWMRLLLLSTAPYQVEYLYRRCLTLLDQEHQDSLKQYLITLIVNETEKARDLIRLLPELQQSMEEPILDAEQITELLSGQDQLEYPYGVGPMLALLPAEDRASTVRTLWAKVPTTARVRFLLTVASEFREPMGPDLTEFILGNLGSSLREDDEKFLFYEHYVDQIGLNSTHLETNKAIADVILEARPREWAPRFLLAGTLQRQGDLEQALSIVTEALVDRLSTTDEFEWRRAVDQTAERFLPEHLDRFLEAIDEQGTPTVEVTRRRLQLVTSSEDPEALIVALKQAVERHPDDQDLSQRLYSEYANAGQQVEAVQVLAAVAENDPSSRQRLARAWQELHHPIRALEALGEPAEPDPQADPDPEGNPRKVDPPSIAAVKEALDAGDEETARIEFRRLWRWGGTRMSEALYQLVSSGQAIIVGGIYGPPDPAWPEDPPEEEPADATDQEDPRERGGLFSYSEEAPPEPESAMTAYEVLATTGFGRDEMQRHLRIDPGTPDRIRHVVDGLSLAMTEQQGAAAAFAALREMVLSGKGRKAEYIQLLNMLEDETIADDPAVRELLSDMIDTVDPTDSAEILRLARVYAVLGEVDLARQLYAWCATLSGGNGLRISIRIGELPGKIIAQAKLHLSGDELLDIVETVLELARPSDDRYAYGVEEYELLVIDTWEEILGPSAALERCREICEDVTDVRRALRRTTAMRAAALLARAGEIEQAIACLEVALCKLPTDNLDLEHNVYARPYGIPGRLGEVDLRRLFPSETTEWADAAGWLRAASSAMLKWLAVDRITADSIPALALIALRLYQTGDTAAGEALVTSLSQRAGVVPAKRLWIIDVAREIGAVELADRMEHALLDASQLNVVRIAEVVARVAEGQGPDAALQLGEQAISYTVHPRLLETLVDIARESGRSDQVERWESLTADAARARAQLRQRLREDGE